MIIAMSVGAMLGALYAFGVGVGVINSGVNWPFVVMDWGDAQRSIFVQPLCLAAAFLGVFMGIMAFVCGFAAVGAGLGYLAWLVLAQGGA